MPVAVDGYEHYDAVSLGRRRHGLETVRRDGEEVAHEPRGLPPGFVIPQAALPERTAWDGLLAQP